MANLQSTNITGTLSVNGTPLGGNLSPKFQEFTSSGNFNASTELIDAGGYIEIFLVGGGGSSDFNTIGGAGGETIITQMYLTSSASCSVTIGAGGNNGTNGGSTTFNGSSAGGSNITALGGVDGGDQNSQLGAGWGSDYRNFNDEGIKYEFRSSAGNGVFGYGAGGATSGFDGGVYVGKPNSGQGAYLDQQAGSGYCLIKWYE